MVRISFEISEETLEVINQLIKDFEKDSYTVEDAYRAIFEMGIKAYQIEQSKPSDDDLRWQLITLASQYSAIKFKNNQLIKENKMLEMRLNSCEAENKFIKELINLKSDEQ